MLSIKVNLIKTHNITLTFFVFIYIPPIYIFWKSSPLPQSIVYFISTHTIKSHNKIKHYPPLSPIPLPSLSYTIILTIPLITHLNSTPIQYNHPFHPNNTTPHFKQSSPTLTKYLIKSSLYTHIYPHIKHIHTITSIYNTPNTLLLTRIFPLHNTINITHYT